jgi:hypothetical protein
VLQPHGSGIPHMQQQPRMLPLAKVGFNVRLCLPALAQQAAAQRSSLVQAYRCMPACGMWLGALPAHSDAFGSTSSWVLRLSKPVGASWHVSSSARRRLIEAEALGCKVDYPMHTMLNISQRAVSASVMALFLGLIRLICAPQHACLCSCT